jgi:4-hydroxy-3-methylbut-2-en-1-yl diphosphate synthase IspG/GcpE
MKCPYCGRKMSSLSFGCKVCRRPVWRLPQILMVSILGAVSVIALLLLVDFLARL